MRYKYAVIAGLVLGFGLWITMSDITTPGADFDVSALRRFKHQSSLLASELRLYKQKHGRYPDNNLGIHAISDHIEQKKKIDSMAATYWRLTTPSGALTWWSDPIIYENRIGYTSDAFKWSSVNADPEREYSYRVDDGIYLWSVGGEDARKRLDKRKQYFSISMVTTLSLTAILLAAFVIGNLRNHRQEYLIVHVVRAVGLCLYGIFLVLLVALPPYIFWPVHSTSGRPQRRTPELTQKYISAMRIYRDHGIISKETFDQRIQALELDEKDENYRRYTDR